MQMKVFNDVNTSHVDVKKKLVRALFSMKLETWLAVVSDTCNQFNAIMCCV